MKRYQRFLLKKENIEKEIERLNNTIVKPTKDVNIFLKRLGYKRTFNRL